MAVRQAITGGIRAHASLNGGADAKIALEVAVQHARIAVVLAVAGLGCGQS